MDENTNNSSLQLDSVIYKPSSIKTTFANRRMWAQHRSKLKEIMHAKKIELFSERSRRYVDFQPNEKNSPEESDGVHILLLLLP